MPSPFILFQHLVPQHAVSRMVGRFAASEVPWLKSLLIRRFIAAFGVNMDEAARKPEEYSSFNDFFTRELAAGARPIADGSQFVVSPADGEISQLGTIEQGRIFQAKGHHFTVDQLLGKEGQQTSRRFLNGQFATIYLSPRDYHRVHMPTPGTLRSATYVPGKLFSVNQTTAQNVEGLFARNERLACLFDGAGGCFASVMVGAMIVAGIETVWPTAFATHNTQISRQTFAPEQHSFEAGDEMGRFYLGSTVVLLFEPGRVEWLEGLKAGDPVRMGQAIGRRIVPG